MVPQFHRQSTHSMPASLGVPSIRLLWTARDGVLFRHSGMGNCDSDDSRLLLHNNSRLFGSPQTESDLPAALHNRLETGHLFRNSRVISAPLLPKISVSTLKLPIFTGFLEEKIRLFERVFLVTELFLVSPLFPFQVKNFQKIKIIKFSTRRQDKRNRPSAYR